MGTKKGISPAKEEAALLKKKAPLQDSHNRKPIRKPP